MLTAMDPAVAPKAPRPDPHECLVWVKQAVYGNEYTLNLNGYKTSVQTPVSAVKSIGTSVIEYRISSEDIADALRRGFEGGSVTTAATVLPNLGTYEGTKVVDAVFGPAGADGLQVEITGGPNGVTITGVVSGGSGWEEGDLINVFAKDISKEGVIESINSSFAPGSLNGVKSCSMLNA